MAETKCRGAAMRGGVWTVALYIRSDLDIERKTTFGSVWLTT
jgi:hypothetical protein